MTEERLVRSVLQQWKAKKTLGIIARSKASADEKRARVRLLAIIGNPGLLQAEITRFRGFDPDKAFDRWKKQQDEAKKQPLMQSALRWSAAAALLLVFGGGIVYVIRHYPRGARETVLGSAKYDTLTAPPAQQRRMILADGTRVWLNNVSRLRYPARFDGRMRTVELSGEAYFEVATNVNKPFIVRTDKQETEVLATSFDVKAYPDDGMALTTVVTGEVRVSSAEDTVIVRAGEQAQLDAAGRSQGVTKVAPGEGISWRDGYLDFSRATLTDVMHQVARRYDLEVYFIGSSRDITWSGKLPPNVPLNKLLDFFEENHIHCRLLGRQLFVQTN